MKVLPSRDPDQLRHLLEALAAVTSFVTTPIEQLLRSETVNLPWGAAVVVITGIVTPPMLSELVRLRRGGRKLALISLDEDWVPDEEQLEGISIRRAKSAG